MSNFGHARKSIATGLKRLSLAPRPFTKTPNLESDAESAANNFESLYTKEELKDYRDAFDLFDKVKSFIRLFMKPSLLDLL